MFHVCLNNRIAEFSSNKSLSIKDGIFWIHCNLVLGSISDETFIFSEGNIRWSGSVALIIGDDELDRGEAQLKNLASGEQKSVSLDLVGEAIAR